MKGGGGEEDSSEGRKAEVEETETPEAEGSKSGGAKGGDRGGEEGETGNGESVRDIEGDQGKKNESTPGLRGGDITNHRKKKKSSNASLHSSRKIRGVEETPSSFSISSSKDVEEEEEFQGQQGENDSETAVFHQEETGRQDSMDDHLQRLSSSSKQIPDGDKKKLEQNKRPIPLRKGRGSSGSAPTGSRGVGEGGGKVGIGPKDSQGDEKEEESSGRQRPQKTSHGLSDDRMISREEEEEDENEEEGGRDDLSDVKTRSPQGGCTNNTLRSPDTRSTATSITTSATDLDLNKKVFAGVSPSSVTSPLFKVPSAKSAFSSAFSSSTLSPSSSSSSSVRRGDDPLSVLNPMTHPTSDSLSPAHRHSSSSSPLPSPESNASPHNTNAVLSLLSSSSACREDSPEVSLLLSMLDNGSLRTGEGGSTGLYYDHPSQRPPSNGEMNDSLLMNLLSSSSTVTPTSSSSSKTSLSSSDAASLLKNISSSSLSSSS
ncbi:hypothetical protein CSUI_006147, partial [Cystoisospora suis]